MKRSISFTDGYGIALIASGLPGVDRLGVAKLLGPDAKKLGMAIINTKSASKKGTSLTTKAQKGHKTIKSVS